MPKKITQPITLSSSVADVAGVTPTLKKTFGHLNITTVGELLFYLPTRYMDFRKSVSIGQAQVGEIVTLTGQITKVTASSPWPKYRKSFTSITLEDGSGSISAIWFNQPYIAKQLKIGDQIILSGQIGYYKKKQIVNPAYDVIIPKDSEQKTDTTISQTNLNTGTLIPVYRRSNMIPLRTLRKVLQNCISVSTDIIDEIPLKLLQQHSLVELGEALRTLHFPESDRSIKSSRLRVAVDDLLPQQLAVVMQKDLRKNTKSPKIQADIALTKQIIAKLPFTLTNSQKRAMWDVYQDLETGIPMNRLLQGDVGSGKTIVAFMSAIQVALHQLQTAILAPTEILAKQHYDNLMHLLSTVGLVELRKLNTALLTNSFALLNGEAITKKELTQQLQSGEISICVGTHALLQNKETFAQLGMLVIDEQHRFGVAQRNFLLGNNAHLLSMSATPIPRTLALGIYGDLDISVLTQIPNQRPPVRTTLVSEAHRRQAYETIRQEIIKGRQAFIVTPRVEETDNSEVKSVKKEFETLQQQIFPQLRLGLLHGKMKNSDKETTMSEFISGNLDVLVTTSIIEIGIDIPNATIILIEGSERFGLAQLHQLRGRVGRSNYPSQCFLFTTDDNHLDSERLKILTKTTDGFALANLDLQTRGFGDIFGEQQSGFVFRFPQFISLKALEIARELAQAMFAQLSKKQISQSSYFQKAQGYLKNLHLE